MKHLYLWKFSQIFLSHHYILLYTRPAFHYYIPYLYPYYSPRHILHHNRIRTLFHKLLLSHYHNVICFHGHSHESLNSQEYTEKLSSPLPANYDYTLGCHSVHIPSLSIPYDVFTGERVIKSEKSEGYLMDIYENHIVLRGWDFVTGKSIPIANYCLDTTRKTIEPNTYTDSTGTIKTIR